MDPRYIQLASLLVNHSAKVKKGDRVLIHRIDDVPDEMIIALIQEVRRQGGLPWVTDACEPVMHELLKRASPEELKATLPLLAKADAAVMRKMDCYIGIRGMQNSAQMSDVPQENMKLFKSLHYKPVHLKIRVPKTRWVVTRWPTPSFAQKAEMSDEGFTDFFFRTTTGVDYAKMLKEQKKLVALMNKTDRVTIKGRGTDLSFSIKGIPAVPCYGDRNVPDGEVFTAPVKTSVEGHITFNTPTTYQGNTFSGIKLVFRKGKIVEATCETGDQKALNAILDTDAGARYIGEFAFGHNPEITKAMSEILFDEKILGSFHFTPGACYKEAPNGVKSAIHWDMVQLGDGIEIYFDGKLVRKDGFFIPKSLHGLNPPN